MVAGGRRGRNCGCIGSCQTGCQGDPVGETVYVGNGYDLSMLGYAEIPEEDRTEETKPLVARRFQGVDGQELSEMMQLSHERVLEEVVKKRQENPAYMPVTIATIPQIRMTRRIVGGYTMETSDDWKEFEDSIGMIGNWNIGE